MSKTMTAFRWVLLACTPLLAAGALGAVGCGLDDSATIVPLQGGGSADASIGDSGGRDTGSTTGACANSPCENGGSCANDSAGGFTCTCASGFTGTTCATNTNDCVSADGGNVCLNGGTCTDGVASYSCSCAPGYTGTNCETNVDNCASNPCAHGTCTDGVDTYSCACATGFGGANCDACATDYYGYPTCTFCTAAGTCNSHGTCSGTGTCTCSAAFTGTACDACATDYYSYPTCTFCTPANTCSNHGTCSGTGTCQCAANYSGTNCGTFSGTYSGSAAMPNNSTSDEYGQVNGTAAFSTTTTVNRITPGVNTTLKNLTFGPSSGDIGGRTWTATVMKNGAATGLTCTIAMNGTSCTITTNVALNSTDAINIDVIQSATTGTDRTATWSIDYTQP